ncbi:hypothetical protein KC360_g5564 [Hortaea werneckii]|nr:hypothetical protein KC325_g5157 [Hortaea werneckii]KAI6991609.1 hypothetical protein KC359_g6132 [Hortaea werneckii]KAI7144279.1 hypothetical protein KC344_g5540 [Hortaea werneckii]KAI7172371.1 hypothetical protein KC360_g5564 [Hortaea werneckii]
MASGWDDVPAPVSDAWQADDSAAAGEASFNGEFSPENISKHADGDLGGAAADGGCRICHEEGHFARDCPDKKSSGECFNCGEMGHNKAECQNPRVEREFTGECNFCGQPGHRRVDCPNKPAETCKICKQEGHIAANCTANRMFAEFQNLGIQDMSAEDAWKMLQEADKDKDVIDIKKALLSYVKAWPEVTFEELENVFRESEMNTHLIAKEQEVSDTHTIVNLAGQQDQKYVVSIQFSEKPRRAAFATGWPPSKEENLIRLSQAGWPMDRMVPKCVNCDQLGHISKNCPEEKREREQKTAITCANCNNEGHRARDCPEPRKTGRGKGCRNCGQEGHISKECPKPPNLDNVECKNCSKMGHFSRDCPEREPEICRNCQKEGHRAKDCTEERVMICRNCDGHGHAARDCPEPKNMAKVLCRNCDEFGHQSRECPKPTDWSRVECSNCHEKGHTYKRCTKPAAEAEGDGGWDNGAGTGGASADKGGASWQDNSTADTSANGGGDSWGGAAAAAATANGW